MRAAAMPRSILGWSTVILLLPYCQSSYSSEDSCARFVPGRHLHVPEFESSEDAAFPDETPITFKCDAGYRLRGAPTLLCLLGSWFGAVPTCKPLVNCTEPDFEWGGYTGDCCSPGDEVNFHCFNEPRFHLTGANSATCLPDGRWNETIPFCQDTYCNDPGFSTNSDRLLMWDNTPYIGDVCCPLQTTAVYSCHEGYALDGVSSLQCRKNGTWSSPVPKCRKQTCTRFMPGAHLIVEEFEATIATDFAEGTDINFRCDDGYLLQGDFSAMCHEGAWSARMPYCEQIRCTPLRSPLHGWMSGGSSTAVGATAKFGCAEGYRLLGTEERRCHDNGLWSGQAVRCLPEAIFSDPNRSSCTDAGDPDNGYQNFGDATTILGTFVSFTCYPGYHMLGSPIVLCDSLLQLQSRPICTGKFHFMHRGEVRQLIQRKLESFAALPNLLGLGNVTLPQRVDKADPAGVRRIVYFLLEASTTIGAKNFRKKINLVTAITRQLKAAHHNRFGVIVCAEDARLVVDPANFSDTIVSLKNLNVSLHNFADSDRGCINDAMARIRYSIETIKMKFGNNVEFVLFFLTDGYSLCGMTAPTPYDKLLERIYEYSFTIAEETDRLRLWPWLVTIHKKGISSVCAGTIISRKWIMTTGRCVSDAASSNLFSPTDLVVQAKISCPEDTYFIDQCSQMNLTVKRIHRHEAYHHVNVFHDISLLELEHETEYDEFLRPVCLPFPEGTDPAFYTPGEEVLLVTPEPRALYNLRQIKMERGSPPFCLTKAGNSFVAPGMMCAEYKNFGGDYAGAALMQASWEEEIMWTQVGISSWLLPKKNNSIRVFTNVSYYLPWIKRHLLGNM
ncbi:uncharacterized protein LOC144151590 isoform X2 [Haemaphysalis longicornis]